MELITYLSATAICQNAGAALDGFLAGVDILFRTIPDEVDTLLLDAGVLHIGEHEVWFELTLLAGPPNANNLTLRCHFVSETLQFTVPLNWKATLILGHNSFVEQMNDPSGIVDWEIPRTMLVHPRNPNRVIGDIQITLAFVP